MPSDRADPAIWRSAQDRALARYARREQFAYSASTRARMQAAGLTAQSITNRASLSRLPAVAFAEVGPPTALVLRPSEESIRAHGDPALAWRVRWARFTGRPARANRELLDPVYKPVHWHLDGGVPIASSSEDVDRVAEIGRRSLELAGIGPYDALVGIAPPGPHLSFWQLALGCREAGLSALHVPPSPTAAEVEAWEPTVLAGRAADLAALLADTRREGRQLRGLHTLLVVGEALDDDGRARLAAVAPRTDVAVVASWAPPGVRAQWTECRGGAAFHTWPDSEVVEVVDVPSGKPVRGEGEVVWTALEWKGSALVRLRTGVRGVLDESRCASCGRTTPRLRVTVPPPPPPAPPAVRPRRRATARPVAAPQRAAGGRR